MVDGLTVHEQNLEAACTPELYATDLVLERVAKGENFRDVYRDVGLNLDKVQAIDPKVAIQGRSGIGTTGNLGLEEQQARINTLADVCENRLTEYQAVYQNLCALEAVALVDY
ncbi:MAG: argininosuccinate lyase, partial [Spirochaetales bacterium]|nr:argininosuccinate lyase [Spirochaetales bacterium]